MQLDPSRYSHFLDGYDMTEQEKLVFMDDVWAILNGNIDRIFTESSEQILMGIKAREAGAMPGSALDSRPSIQPIFRNATIDGRRESEI